MKIRPAQAADAPVMARVIIDTFLETNRGLMSEAAWQRRKDEWTYDVSARYWLEVIEAIKHGDVPMMCLFVAEDERGDVVGFAYGCPSSDELENGEDCQVVIGEVDVLYVRKSHQRQGYGRALAQATALYLARRGMKKLHICTPDNSVDSRRFYEKLGGQVVKTRDDFEDEEKIVLVVYEWADIWAFANEEQQPNK